MTIHPKEPTMSCYGLYKIFALATGYSKVFVDFGGQLYPIKDVVMVESVVASNDAPRTYEIHLR